MVKRFAAALRLPLLLLLLPQVGCFSDDPPCDLRVCDIRDRGCQQTASRAAACLLQRPPLDIPVVLLTEAEYVANEVAGSMQGDQVKEKRRLDALALIDLADADISPQQVAEIGASRVGAYYESGVKRITIITSNDPRQPLDDNWYMSALVHEFTHAHQDAAGHLAWPQADGDISYDRWMARGALVEGEASLTQSLATLGIFVRDWRKVPWEPLFTRLHQLSEGGLVNSAAALDLAYSYFSYPYGLSTVYRPFEILGTDGLAALWQNPPRSARQVLLDRGPGTPTPAPSVDLGPQSTPADIAGLQRLESDRMGAYLFKIALLRGERRVAAQTPFRLHVPAADLAAELRGDYLTLYTTGPEAVAPVVVWRLRFSSPASAAAAATQLRELATRDGLDPVRWRVTEEANDVIWIAFRSNGPFDPASITAWQAPPSPLPAPAAPPPPPPGRVTCARFDPALTPR